MKGKSNIQSQKSNIQYTLALPLLSGLLMTGAFPKVGMDWLAWFALVPLLISLRRLSLKKSFLAGFVAGLSHYLTLTYWLAYTMKTYGNLPLVLCIPILLLLSAYLGLYVAVFSMGVSRVCMKPGCCILMIPLIWVALEYVRSFFLTGFPWELLGYSQFRHLNLIQITDISGVYGVSCLLALSNAAIFLAYLRLKGEKWQGTAVSRRVAAGSVICFALMFGLAWSYGKWRVASVDQAMTDAPSLKVAIVQGNIDQAKKWDAAFRHATIRKYVELSLSAKPRNPDLLVWPETATPFYFLHNTGLSRIVIRGIQETGSDFLIGSPSFVREGERIVAYHNSAYLVSRSGEILGKYDKAHLVPFGEYVPLKKWLPFIGKMVEHVGDFRPGEEGKTLLLRGAPLGIQICYEIIFPNLSRAMVKNDAALLINITNDAWYGTTSAPYQHFSMTLFRAVENKRSLIRSANTGISGFIDPAGRMIASTPLFADAVLTRAVPLLTEKTLYTRFGDIFAMICLTGSVIVFIVDAWMRQQLLCSDRKKN